MPCVCLSAKNKITFVHKSIEIATPTYPKFPIWQQYNDIVLSWILNSLPDIDNIVIYVKQPLRFGIISKRDSHKEMIPENSSIFL